MVEVAQEVCALVPCSSQRGEGLSSSGEGGTVCSGTATPSCSASLSTLGPHQEGEHEFQKWVFLREFIQVAQGFHNPVCPFLGGMIKVG